MGYKYVAVFDGLFYIETDFFMPDVLK